MSFFRFFDCDLTAVDDGEMFSVARCNELVSSVRMILLLDYCSSQ